MYAQQGSTLVPRFLGDGDHPWLAALLAEYDRSVGATRAQLESRLKAIELPAAPTGSRMMATAVLLSLTKDKICSAVKPALLRSTLFEEAVGATDRTRSISSAAAKLGLTAHELEQQLFADLPSERIVQELSSPLTPNDLALRSNLAFAQSLLFRSTSVRLELEGQAHAIVRQARLGGLICSVESTPDHERAQLDISGPVSLFHQTLLYGRSLSRLLPLLAWCDRFELKAALVLQERALEFRLRSPAPIFPSAEPRKFDSKLEARFAKAFARLASDWVLIREPAPIRAGCALIFPDFLARHRSDERRFAFIELVGYWTPSYLDHKRMTLRSAKLDNLIICVDDDLACEEGDWPSASGVVRFRRKLDPAQVLAAIEAATGSSPQDRRNVL